MKLTFVGADHEVTGSCHYLQVCADAVSGGGADPAAGDGRCREYHILVDYGMEQGQNHFENIPLPVAPADIDFLFITHAHIDHTGMLPALYGEGFRGRIICTGATKELADIMLRDSAHIQMQEAEYANRKAGRRGSGERVRPLYTMEDTMNVLQLFETCSYGEMLRPAPGIAVRFTDVGHLLGSASIEIWLTENGQTRKIVFSGDIGNTDQPLLRDPQTTARADYVVMESTYGNRYHDRTQNRHMEQLAAILRRTLLRGGNLVIPAFAVGRTQALLYYIRLIKENSLVPEMPDFPVYVDSPMAVAAISIFENNDVECYDEDAQAMLARGVNPLTFSHLHLSITQQESMAINEDAAPKVIISASGMCDAGRIRHHLKYNIGNPKSTVLFVGYQSEGTLGRRLQDGAQKVKLFGNEYDVRAEVAQIDGMSGHADRQGLLDWIGAFEEKPRQVFVVHGDDEASTSFADCLEQEYGYRAMAPYSGTQYDLLEGRFVRIAKPVPARRRLSAKAVRASADSYTRLRLAARQLNTVVEGASGLPAGELDAFTRELEDLCRRYRIQ